VPEATATTTTTTQNREAEQASQPAHRATRYCRCIRPNFQKLFARAALAPADVNASTARGTAAHAKRIKQTDPRHSKSKSKKQSRRCWRLGAVVRVSAFVHTAESIYTIAVSAGLARRHRVARALCSGARAGQRRKRVLRITESAARFDRPARASREHRRTATSAGVCANHRRPGGTLRATTRRCARRHVICRRPRTKAPAFCRRVRITEGQRDGSVPPKPPIPAQLRLPDMT
jgi:hypothetical protein